MRTMVSNIAGAIGLGSRAVVLVIGVIDLAVSVITAMCWATVTRE